MRLISPFKTLNSCGSSSMLVLRKKAPTIVTRGILFDLEDRTIGFVQVLDLFQTGFCVDHHGPELVDVEHSLVQAEALLHKKDRTGRGQFDKYRGQQHHGREKNNGRQGHKDVDGSLDQQSPEIGDGRLMADQRIAIQFVGRVTGFLRSKMFGRNRTMIPCCSQAAAIRDAKV